MRLTLVLFFLISSTLNFETFFEVKSNFSYCTGDKGDRLGRVVIIAKTKSDSIEGWAVRASFVVLCKELDEFTVQVDTTEEGGVVTVKGEKNFFPGKGFTMGPTTARKFVEFNKESRAAVDRGSVVGIVIRNKNKAVDISYRYVNPDMLKLLEDLGIPYQSNKNEYNVPN